MHSPVTLAERTVVLVVVALRAVTGLGHIIRDNHWTARATPSPRPARAGVPDGLTSGRGGRLLLPGDGSPALAGPGELLFPRAAPRPEKTARGALGGAAARHLHAPWGESRGVFFLWSRADVCTDRRRVCCSCRFLAPHSE
ncbi:unnamed protein product [Prorocentrum cordatum]|uniref:Secreted protein n=1 Tax=Prorocentrum cordatum TaxID=2364126 RepID=A0ABN9T9H7_9DINO|nr:unnamed protein product [Polarella glacialis]